MKINELLDSLKRHRGKDLSCLNNLIFLQKECFSYRGMYEHLAIKYSAMTYQRIEDGITKVDEFIDFIESQEGKMFTGWKGGEYTVDFDLELYISNEGCWNGTYVSGIETDKYGDVNLLVSNSRFN